MPGTAGDPGAGGSAVQTAGTGGLPGQGNAGQPGASAGSAGTPLPGGGSGGSAGGGGGPPGVPGVWAYRKAITLDTTAAGADVGEDIENYPLAVVLTAENFDFSQAQATGADIRFFSTEGMPLPYHIELWDSAAEVAALWVLLDVVSGNSTQQVIMKWGNPTATDEGDSKAVFSQDAGFLAVFHLDEEGSNDPGGFLDSSWNEVHGTGINMEPGSRVPARIGMGVKLENPNGGGATAEWIEVSGPKVTDDFNATAEHPITATAWAWADSFEGYYETIFSKGDRSWTLQCDYQDRIEACTHVPNYHSCAIWGPAGSCDNTVDRWTHYMITQRVGNLSLYIDGQRRAGAGGNSTLGDHSFGIGNQTQYGQDERGWNGMLDEVRVFAVEKPEAWAKLEFEFQKPDQTSVTFGATEPEPEP